MSENRILEEYNRKEAKIHPVGYKILVAMPPQEEQTKGGVHLPEEHIHKANAASITGMVLELGPDAFRDKKRFPSGAWCKPGDWVVFRAYSGTKMNVGGQEVRLINDETVDALADDPREVVRA